MSELPQNSESPQVAVAQPPLVMPLPCPFCGGKDIRFNEHGPMFVQRGEALVRNPDTIWSMCCYDCGATFPNRGTKEPLMKCWNRRPNSRANKQLSHPCKI
jgi:Lar family restriction alleviation protein